jgi:CRISPR-associated protein Cas2
MFIIIANHLPPAVRGRLKLWFVEPKPNIFISGIRDSVADSVVSYLFEYCTKEAGLLIFRDLNKPPWFSINSLGDPAHQISEICKLQLILEKESPPYIVV